MVYPGHQEYSLDDKISVIPIESVPRIKMASRQCPVTRAGIPNPPAAYHGSLSFLRLPLVTRHCLLTAGPWQHACYLHGVSDVHLLDLAVELERRLFVVPETRSHRRPAARFGLPVLNPSRSFLTRYQFSLNLNTRFHSFFMLTTVQPRLGASSRPRSSLPAAEARL